MFESSLSSSVYRCSRNIDKLAVLIRLEQVAQYGVANSTNKLETGVSNLKIDKTITWMEKIQKKQCHIILDESQLQNDETDLNRLHCKDIFYTITTDNEFKPENVDMPFYKGNLGYHCENNMTFLRKQRYGIPKTEDNQLDKITTYQKRNWQDDTQCMHIVLDINAIVIGDELKDSILVTLKYNESLGELKVYPSANAGHLGYRLTPRGLTPPFFLYWIQLVQQQHLIYSEPHGSVGTMAPSLHFERINYGSLILTLFLTIIKFKFSNMSKEKHFSINYSINLPKGWSLSPEEDDRFGRTDMSMDIGNGVFQHLISYSLINHLNLNQGLKWPSISMELQSDCGTGSCTEGLCSLTVPSKPGRFFYSLVLNNFKEKQKSIFGKLFSGSRSNISQELLMTSNPNITEEHQARYGLVSEPIGTLEVELQTIHHSANGEKKK